MYDLEMSIFLQGNLNGIWCPVFNGEENVHRQYTHIMHYTKLSWNMYDLEMSIFYKVI